LAERIERETQRQAEQNYETSSELGNGIRKLKSLRRVAVKKRARSLKRLKALRRIVDNYEQTWGLEDYQLTFFNRGAISVFPNFDREDPARLKLGEASKVIGDTMNKLHGHAIFYGTTISGNPFGEWKKQYDLLDSMRKEVEAYHTQMLRRTMKGEDYHAIVDGSHSVLEAVTDLTSAILKEVRERPQKCA